MVAKLPVFTLDRRVMGVVIVTAATMTLLGSAFAHEAWAQTGGLLSRPLAEVSPVSDRAGPDAKGCEGEREPVPEVVSVTPSSGPAGRTVKVTGYNFEWEEDCAVRLGVKRLLFGGVPATEVYPTDPGELSAVVPPGTGSVEVIAETLVKQQTRGPLFTYREAPSVTSVSPVSGPLTGGTTVIITGSGFSEVSAVDFTGSENPAKSFKVESEHEIVAVTPAVGLPGNYCVNVTTPLGRSAFDAGCAFHYVLPPPTVTKIAPARGPTIGGTTVKISGTGFQEVTKVSFGSAAATSYKVESETSISAVAPAGSGTQNVTVTTVWGTSEPVSADEFAYFVAAPTFVLNGKQVGVEHRPVLTSGTWIMQSPALGEVKCEILLFGEVWNQTVSGETRGVGEVTGLESGPGANASCRFEGLELGGPGELPGQFKAYVIAEGPLEATRTEAEVCPSPSEQPSKCGEKHVESLISSIGRARTSLPWKTELIRGTRQGEAAILQRAGVGSLGEAASADDAQDETGTCYPQDGSSAPDWRAVPAGCIRLTVVAPQIPAEYVLYGSQEIQWINGAKNGLFPSRLHFEEAGGLCGTSAAEAQAGEEDQTCQLSTLEGEDDLLGANSLELVTVR